MKKWFALSAIARDHPGIVADLAELIYECDCNLEDSSMTVLGGEFAVLLLLSGQGPDIERRLSSACKRLEWEKRVTAFFRPLEGEPMRSGIGERVTSYELHATGVDKAGIVARVARCLADHAINITQMQTHSQPEPGSGTAIYTMQIHMDVPASVGIPALLERLEHIADELHIHIDLIPATGNV
jgi:glycine cleavage system transcriptional repressor